MKIHIIPYPTENFNYLYTCPRGDEIVRVGLLDNGVILVDHPDEADFIFHTYVPHYGGEKWNTKNLEQYDSSKLVIIDWIDEPDRLLYDKYHVYFKRSSAVPITQTGSWQISTRKIYKRLGDKVFPFSYCAMKSFFYPEQEKTIDVGCYLRETCPNRIAILQYIRTVCQMLNVNHRVGPVNSTSRSEGSKTVFDNEYLKTLAQTKIVVTCNPTWWEGDTRLWEALANNCCVFVDKMFMPYFSGLAGGIHIVEYDLENSLDLLQKLGHYIQYPDEAKTIATHGLEAVKRDHTEKARMREVLNILYD